MAGQHTTTSSLVAMSLRPKGGVIKKTGVVPGRSKDQVRPWTEQEQQKLRALVLPKVQAANGDYHNIDWTQVAKHIPGRTGKQCREKWKNDLRPDITKEAWSKEEEYILALAHSKVGNRWSEITKFLPRRAENTIKNHWFSTNRAKAKNKTNSFLFVYGTIANNNWTPGAGQKLFKDAIKKYRSLEGVTPLEEFQVPEDYFVTEQAQQSSHTVSDEPLPNGRTQPARWYKSEDHQERAHYQRQRAHYHHVHNHDDEYEEYGEQDDGQEYEDEEQEEYGDEYADEDAQDAGAEEDADEHDKAAGNGEDGAEGSQRSGEDGASGGTPSTSTTALPLLAELCNPLLLSPWLLASPALALGPAANLSALLYQQAAASGQLPVQATPAAAAAAASASLAQYLLLMSTLYQPPT